MRRKTFQLLAVLGLVAFAAATICVAFGFTYAAPAALFFLPAGLLLTWRRPARRGTMLGIAAGASVLVAIALYFLSLQVVIIENRSGQAISQLMITPNDNGIRGYTFDLSGLPKGYHVRFQFHDLFLCDGVSCDGALRNGTSLGWDGIQAKESCHHTTRITIGPHGVCHYSDK